MTDEKGRAKSPPLEPASAPADEWNPAPLEGSSPLQGKGFSEPMPPDGWPLRQAIFTLVSDKWRNTANLLYDLESSGAGSSVSRNLLWLDLCEQLKKRKIIATGIRDKEAKFREIDPRFLAGAEPDFAADLIVSGGIVFRGILLRPTTIDQSGSPGRPSSRHLWLKEFHRRVEAGLILGKLADEAKWLADWLITHYPDKPRAGKGAIENEIRDEFKAAVGKPPKTPL